MAGNGTFVSLNGNITRDAEVAQTQGGNLVVSFGIACNGSRKDGNGQWVDVPHFFDVAAFVTDAQLRIVQPKLRKGAKAHIEGELRYRKWTDKQSGQDRSAVSVAVTDPVRGIVCEEPRQAGAYQQPAQQYQAPQAYQAPAQAYQQPAQQYQAPVEAYSSVYDEDIPF